jgi:hypothetical protein
MSKRGNNEGSIYKRADGRWAAAVTLDSSGKRKTFYGSSRAEVAAKLAKALRDKQQGLPASDDRLTVAAFVASWLESTAQPSGGMTASWGWAG